MPEIDTADTQKVVAYYVLGSLKRLDQMATAVEGQISADMKPAEFSRLMRTAMAIREKVIKEGSKITGDVLGVINKDKRKIREA